MSDGGKGSAPRKTQDQEAYSKGWDAIFGGPKKDKQQEEPKKDHKENKDAMDS